MSPDEADFSQEYFVYFKKNRQSMAAKGSSSGVLRDFKQALSEELLARTIGREALKCLNRENLVQEVESEATEILAQIQTILDDDALDDPECFDRIKNLYSQPQTPPGRVFFRRTSLNFLEIHPVFLRKFALPCREAPQGGAFSAKPPEGRPTEKIPHPGSIFGYEYRF